MHSLNINISKYSDIIFTKLKNPLTFDYVVGGNKINIKSHV